MNKQPGRGVRLGKGAPQIPPLRGPGFPAEVGGVGAALPCMRQGCNSPRVNISLYVQFLYMGLTCPRFLNQP
jgi:hypothetical protein